MRQAVFSEAKRQLPAKAQTTGGFFAFIFNVIDLITSVLGLLDLFGELFPPAKDE